MSLNLPPGTTWLDLGTLIVAGLGLALALISLVLNYRRDRAVDRVRVRMVLAVGPSVYGRAEPLELLLTISNPSLQRTVTIEHTGFICRRLRWLQDRPEFLGWNSIHVGGAFGGFGGAVRPTSQGRLMFNPGDPSETIRAPLYRVRGATAPDVPKWLWCQDSGGGLHWTPIGRSVQAAIAATKRHKLVRDDKYSSRTSIEIDDGEVVAAADLDVDPFHN